EDDNKGLVTRYLKCILPNKNKALKPEPREFSFQEDKDFINQHYTKIHKRSINYEHPRTFTEKMQTEPMVTYKLLLEVP
ncbi:MAG: hypothetical protein ACP5D6_11275, partial [Kosmotogaceae bacterium]